MLVAIYLCQQCSVTWFTRIYIQDPFRQPFSSVVNSCPQPGTWPRKLHRCSAPLLLLLLLLTGAPHHHVLRIGPESSRKVPRAKTFLQIYVAWGWAHTDTEHPACPRLLGIQRPGRALSRQFPMASNRSTRRQDEDEELMASESTLW